MKQVGVMLSGCGFYDGSEIHEAVITLLALDRAGVNAVCMAPNVDQAHVINHLTGEVSDDTRNTLVESARIARGNIIDVQNANAAELDALIFVGGFGAAKNLSSFAFKGADCTVHGDVTRIAKQMHQAEKPIGFICISPAVAAKIFGGEVQLELTIGNDADTAEAITKMGAKHVECATGDIVVDSANRVVSTPAYMCAASITEVATGIEKLVAQALSM